MKISISDNMFFLDEKGVEKRREEEWDDDTREYDLDKITPD